jgi:hypothetical protein
MVFLAGPALAAPNRVALVIGNQSYEDAPLQNPINDANAMAKALEAVGFQVFKYTDLKQADMKKAIDKFGGALQKDGTALFYFSGHGMQVKGGNYLIPIACQIATENDIEYEAVDAGRVLGKMESAGTAVNIVILDACRNDPFSRRFRSTGSKGLAHMDAPRGTLIAYATAPGSTASDGDGENGLYTQELIKHVQTPGITIEDVFKRVRAGVIGQSSGQQTPWESSSLVGDFRFNQASPGGGTGTQTASVGPSAPPPTSGPTVVDQKALAGRVLVTSNVDGARFNLAGREFTTKAGSEITIDQVPAGPQTVVARKDGYSPFQTTLYVESGQTAKLDIYLAEKGGSGGQDAGQMAPSGPGSTQAQGTIQGPAADDGGTGDGGDETAGDDSGTDELLLPGHKLVQDQVLGFSVQVPATWSVQNIEDQGDREIIAISPDQNVAFRARGFNLAAGVNQKQVRASFENLVNQNLLGGTGKVLSADPDELSGIKGETVMYLGQLTNGVAVNIVAFIGVQKKRGFVIWSILPQQQFGQRLTEVLTIAGTFNPGS